MSQSVVRNAKYRRGGLGIRQRHNERQNIAEFAAKKMIIANLINRIEVSAGYRIHIDFNINLEHFNINLEHFNINIDDCIYENKTT